jgi:hypothetical protein
MDKNCVACSHSLLYHDDIGCRVVAFPLYGTEGEPCDCRESIEAEDLNVPEPQ